MKFIVLMINPWGNKMREQAVKFPVSLAQIYMYINEYTYQIFQYMEQTEFTQNYTAKFYNRPRGHRGRTQAYNCTTIYVLNIYL